MIADHAPVFAAIERPDGQHALDTLTVVCQHGIGDISLHVALYQVEERMESTVGIPQRKCGQIRETRSLVYVLVQTAIAAIYVLKDKRMQESMIHRGIESLFLLVSSLDFKFAQLRIPCVHAFLMHASEILAVQLTEIGKRPVGTYTRHRHLHFYLFTRGCIELECHFHILSIRLAVATEAIGIVYHRLVVHIYDSVADWSRERRRKVDMTLRHPTVHKLICRESGVIHNPNVRPLALAPQRVVEVEQKPCVAGPVICEPEYSRTLPRRHFGSDAVVVEVEAIICCRGFFTVVAEARTIAFIRLFMRRRLQMQFTRTGHEQEVAKVRNACSAEVRKTESQHCRMVILVARGSVVVVKIGVRADLYAAERRLSARIDIAEAFRAYERIDIPRQVLTGLFSH